MKIWKSIVGKLWITIILLVAIVLLIVGFFLIGYIDLTNLNNAPDVLKLFIITGVTGFSLTTFFAFFLSFRITQPLLKMKRAAALISRGDYSTRLEVRSSDEIGELSNTFNHMAEQLDGMIQDLNHEKEQLSNVLRSMTDAVITCDADGNVSLSNPRGKLLLQEWGDLMQNGEQDGGRNKKLPTPLLELLQQVVRNSEDCATKVHVHQGVWSVLMTPLYSENTVRGAVAVLRDVSEEHRLEKMRKDFVANVSHELRTPLAMLQGYSEALLDDIADSPEQRRELAQVILDESLRMGRLVNNLLDLAKMEAGTFAMTMAPLNIKPLINRVIRKFAAMSKEQDVALHAELDSADIHLSAADEDRLEQVLTNLVDNALRHTESNKSIIIRAKLSRLNQADAVCVEVVDQGEGIPDEDLPYIFERFYKADKARTRIHTVGTGLGLAIVKNIVDAHKGVIKAESEKGKGTTFSFTLPLN